MLCIIIGRQDPYRQNPCTEPLKPLVWAHCWWFARNGFIWERAGWNLTLEQQWARFHSFHFCFYFSCAFVFLSSVLPPLSVVWADFSWAACRWPRCYEPVNTDLLHEWSDHISGCVVIAEMTSYCPLQNRVMNHILGERKKKEKDISH